LRRGAGWGTAREGMATGKKLAARSLKHLKKKKDHPLRLLSSHRSENEDASCGDKGRPGPHPWRKIFFRTERFLLRRKRAMMEADRKGLRGNGVIEPRNSQRDEIRHLRHERLFQDSEHAGDCWLWFRSWRFRVPLGVPSECRPGSRRGDVLHNPHSCRGLRPITGPKQPESGRRWLVYRSFTTERRRIPAGAIEGSCSTTLIPQVTFPRKGEIKKFIWDILRCNRAARPTAPVMGSAASCKEVAFAKRVFPPIVVHRGLSEQR